MLYAHTRADASGAPLAEDAWQPLPDHLGRVADMAARFAEVFNAAAFARVQGGLHDFGKASDAFQRRLRGGRLRVDHATAGARELLRLWGVGKDGRPDAMGRYLAGLLAYGIVGHHTGLPDCGSPAEASTLRNHLDERLYPVADCTAGSDLVRVPPWSELGAIPLTRASRNDAAFSLSFFIRMLYSCLTDADWLDTERFCDPERGAARSDPWPAVAALEEQLTRELRERGYLEAAPGEAEKILVTGSSRSRRITAARQAILTRCREAAALEPGVFSLTVPTGGGKTLSSLAFALEHARRHYLRRVILVVPYTSIIEQNAQVFRDFLGQDAVLEHHCQYVHPAEETSTETDDRAEADAALHFRLATENWDATLIVTTAVQFFESLFAARPRRCRKLHNIARSVIILDEAQMTPVHLLAPSTAALRELARHYGASLVLCTATQPALHLTDRFRCGFDPKEIREIMPPDLLPRVFDVFRRVTVEDVGTLDDAALALRLAAEERVLCIVNTRRRAREVYEALRATPGVDPPMTPGEDLFHLSARMTPAHRSVVLDAVRRRLEAGLPCRVVSTSLVECGVDISFPAVFRELAGLDSVAQSAGRCNRNGELDQSGRVYVFTPACGLPRNAHDLQRRARLFQDVAGRFSDLFSPEAVRDYFSQLRDYSQTDEAGILDRLYQDNRQADFPCFAFREISRNYRFIPEEDMVSVIVENDVPGETEAAELVRRLENWDADRTVYRRLQRHTVQIYRHELRALTLAGSVEVLHDRFPVLRGGVGYRADVGLDADDPLHLDPMTGIL